MGSINLYKIELAKNTEFIQELSQKMVRGRTVVRPTEVAPGTNENIELTLYTSRPQEDKEVGWSWVFNEFQQTSPETSPSPKALIIIKRDRERLYTVTFGHSYFLVDKFCDRDFGFNFARKLEYKEIKTTTLTTPSSHRNKTVNTYVNYSELEFDSGESFAKLKAKVSLIENFSLYKPAIEIGSSIRFATSEESLDKIISLILHVENTLSNQDDKYQIPVFSKVKDPALLLRLDMRLADSINENPAQINVSELDIIGATEIFNHNDGEFILRHLGVEKVVSTLSSEELELFCRENNWDYGSTVLNISVVSLYDGTPVVTNQIKNLIDYTDDLERCLLSKGVWYKFNEDYLNYLKDSIAEIPAEHHPEYDFTDEIHSCFVDQKYQEEKDDPRYAGRTESQIKDALRKKYYAERAFNLLRGCFLFQQTFSKKCCESTDFTGFFHKFCVCHILTSSSASATI